MSRHATSHSVTSCHVMSRHVMLRRGTSCHVESLGTVTRPTLHCQLTFSTRNSFELSMTVFVGCPEGCRFHTALAVYDLVSLGGLYKWCSILLLLSTSLDIVWYVGLWGWEVGGMNALVLIAVKPVAPDSIHHSFLTIFKIIIILYLYYKYKYHCDWCLYTSGGHAPYTGAAMLCRRVRSTSDAGSRRRVCVAGFHGPVKTISTGKASFQ